MPSFKLESHGFDPEDADSRPKIETHLRKQGPDDLWWPRYHVLGDETEDNRVPVLTSHLTGAQEFVNDHLVGLARGEAPEGADGFEQYVEYRLKIGNNHGEMEFEIKGEDIPGNEAVYEKVVGNLSSEEDAKEGDFVFANQIIEDMKSKGEYSLWANYVSDGEDKPRYETRAKLVSEFDHKTDRGPRKFRVKVPYYYLESLNLPGRDPADLIIGDGPRATKASGGGGAREPTPSQGGGQGDGPAGGNEGKTALEAYGLSGWALEILEERGFDAGVREEDVDLIEYYLGLADRFNLPKGRKDPKIRRVLVEYLREDGRPLLDETYTRKLRSVGNVGRKLMERILERFPTYDALEKADREGLESIERVGTKRAEAIRDGLLKDEAEDTRRGDNCESERSPVLSYLEGRTDTRLSYAMPRGALEGAGGQGFHVYQGAEGFGADPGIRHTARKFTALSAFLNNINVLVDYVKGKTNGGPDRGDSYYLFGADGEFAVAGLPSAGEDQSGTSPALLVEGKHAGEVARTAAGAEPPDKGMLDGMGEWLVTTPEGMPIRDQYNRVGLLREDEEVFLGGSASAIMSCRGSVQALLEGQEEPGSCVSPFGLGREKVRIGGEKREVYDAVHLGGQYVLTAEKRRVEPDPGLGIEGGDDVEVYVLYGRVGEFERLEPRGRTVALPGGSTEQMEVGELSSDGEVVKTINEKSAGNGMAGTSTGPGSQQSDGQEPPPYLGSCNPERAYQLLRGERLTKEELVNSETPEGENQPIIAHSRGYELHYRPSDVESMEPPGDEDYKDIVSYIFRDFKETYTFLLDRLNKVLKFDKDSEDGKINTNPGVISNHISGPGSKSYGAFELCAEDSNEIRQVYTALADFANKTRGTPKKFGLTKKMRRRRELKELYGIRKTMVAQGLLSWFTEKFADEEYLKDRYLGDVDDAIVQRVGSYLEGCGSSGTPETKDVEPLKVFKKSKTEKYLTSLLEGKKIRMKGRSDLLRYDENSDSNVLVETNPTIYLDLSDLSDYATNEDRAGGALKAIFETVGYAGASGGFSYVEDHKVREYGTSRKMSLAKETASYAGASALTALTCGFALPFIIAYKALKNPIKRWRAKRNEKRQWKLDY